MMTSLSLGPTILGTTKKTHAFVSLSVSSMISRLEEHSQNIRGPVSKTSVSQNSIIESNVTDMSNKRRPPPQPNQALFSPRGIELYMRSDETLSNIEQEANQFRRSLSIPNVSINPRNQRRSSLHSAFNPNRLSDWEPPAEWLHVSTNPDSVSGRSSPVEDNQSPKTPSRDLPGNSNILAYRTAGMSAELLLPEPYPSPSPANSPTFSLEKKGHLPATAFITGLPTPPESPGSKNELPGFNHIDASSPPRTNFYSSPSNLAEDRTSASFESNRSISPLPKSSRPIPRIRRGPRRDISSVYSTNDDNYANRAGVIEVGEWTNDEVANSKDVPLSPNAYRILVDDYRRLAQPRISIFEDHDDEDQDEKVVKDIQSTPRPLFWNRSSSRRPPSNISEVSCVSDRAEPSQRRLSNPRPVPSKRTSATFVGRYKHTTSLSAQKAKGTLVISAPICMNEAAYLAAIQTQEPLHGDGPAVDVGAMKFVTDLERPKRPWHHRLSPRNLAFTMTDVRNSVQKVTSPRRWSISHKISSKSSSTLEEDNGSDADSWLSAVENDQIDEKAWQNKNIKLLFDKIKWKSDAKQQRKKNEGLRNAIKHVGAEQGVKSGSLPKPEKWMSS
jgi:hypothetical protein